MSQSYGASFNSIKSLITDAPKVSQNPEVQKELDVYRSGSLPHYQVTTSKFVKNGVDLISRDAKRTLADHSDSFPRLDKLVHANGICLIGEWNITEDSGYSGLFKKGTSAPFIGRVSTATSNTVVGAKRGFGFAGKVFPTNDLDASVQTANFFTVDVLTGTKIPRFLQTTLTNEPPVGFDFSMVYLGLRLGIAFKGADSNPQFRPLYEISEAGLDKNEAVKTPHWMAIQPSSSNVLNNEADFREELNISKHHSNGLAFDIYLSDTTKDPKAPGWKKVGNILAHESVVSYGCDRQLHFHHPKIK